MLTTLLGIGAICAIVAGGAAKLGMVEIKKSITIPVIDKTIEIEFSQENPIKFS